MARITNLRTLYLNTDRPYAYHIKTEDESASVDITGWSLSFMIKERVAASAADPTALVTKTTPTQIVIAGVFNADPAVNAQRATVTIEDSDTVALTPMRCVWELKRTDAGAEQILGYGPIELKRPVHTS